jgi:hypothetical protein
MDTRKPERRTKTVSVILDEQIAEALEEIAFRSRVRRVSPYLAPIITKHVLRKTRAATAKVAA